VPITVVVISIEKEVGTLSMLLIHIPFSLVTITIAVRARASAVACVVLPRSFIDNAICTCVFSFTVFGATAPFAFVDIFVREFNFTTFDLFACLRAQKT
jgi:hypothetical protein